MSRLTDLISQVAKLDAALAADLGREVNVLSSRRPFGLNFERHVPESIHLPLRKIRSGDKVAFREPSSGNDQIWIVTGFEGSGSQREARLVLRAQTDEPKTTVAPISDLVVVAESRDAIYPGLRSRGAVRRGGDKPFQTVISGENFHVLQALSFVCRGQVDCIYIDPPYNSGARDWKYNNDYVDAEDVYRHSKWLAMMERRLLLAKHLLNPAGSVLIVTIDEREYLRLGLLLGQIFSDARIQMVSSVIAQKGVARSQQFFRTDEYIYFVALGDATVVPQSLGSDWQFGKGTSAAAGGVVWSQLRRSGTNSRREDRPTLFYPIFIDPAGPRIVSTGDSLPLGEDPEQVVAPLGTEAIWPVKPDGTHGNWQQSQMALQRLIDDGYVRVGRRNDNGFPISYLKRGSIKKILSGQVSVQGRDPDGGHVLVDASGYEHRFVPGTHWNVASHDATYHGTQLLNRMIGPGKFPFPKSLYAVEDSLRFWLSGKPDAVVLDYFAGSGTTAHAVMRLNRQDGGRRRCILVTNNEVSAEEASALRAANHAPGDAEWEALGICEHITKPRIRAAITGESPDGEPIKGDYKFVDEFPMSEGFAENAEFFDLTYEDPERVRYGLGFEAIAPLLWLRAGSEGARIDAADGPFAVADTYAILFDLDAAAGYVSAVRAKSELRIAYIVTDDETQFQVVAGQLPHSVEPVRLYAAYLDNFRIQAGA